MKKEISKNDKILFIVCSILMIIGVVAGIIVGLTTDEGVPAEKLTISDMEEEHIEFNVFTNNYETYKGVFIAEPEGVKTKDLILHFGNVDLIENATISKNIGENTFTYTVKPKYNGITTMCVETRDGRIVSNSKKFIFSGGTTNPNEYFGIGDIAVDYHNNVEYKVTEILNRKHFDNGYGYGIDTDNNFLLIELEIINRGKESFYINPNNFFVRKYENDEIISTFEYSSHTYSFENGMTSTDLNYGIKKKFVILFEIDEETTVGDYKLFCKSSFLKGGVLIHLK